MSDWVRSHRSGKSNEVSSWNSKSSKNNNSDAAKNLENQHLADSLPKLNTGRKLNATGTRAPTQLERGLSSVKKHRKRFPCLLVKQLTSSSERFFEEDTYGRSHLYSETRVGFQRCNSGMLTTEIVASYRTSKTARDLMSQPVWQPVVSIRDNQRIFKIIPPISPLETEWKCLERDEFNRKEKGFVISDRPTPVEEEEKVGGETHKVCSIYDQKSSHRMSDSEEAKHMTAVLDSASGLNLSSSETSTSNNTAASVNRKSQKVKLKSILLNFNQKMSSACGSHDEDILEEFSVGRSGISGKDLRSDAGKCAEPRPGISGRRIQRSSERDKKSSRRSESSTKGGDRKKKKRRDLSKSLRCRIIYQSGDEGPEEATRGESRNLLAKHPDPRSVMENELRGSRAAQEHDTRSASPPIHRRHRPHKGNRSPDSGPITAEYLGKSGADKAAGSEKDSDQQSAKVQNDPEGTESTSDGYVVYGHEQHQARVPGYPSRRRSRGASTETSTPVPQGPGHQYADAVFTSPCSSPIAAAAADELSSLPEGPFYRQNLQRRSSSIDSSFSRPGSDFLEVPLFMIQARDRSPSICVQDDPAAAAAAESSSPGNSPVGDDAFHCGGGGGDLQYQVVHRINDLVRLPPVTPCQSPVETTEGGGGGGGGQKGMTSSTHSEQVGRGGGMEVAAAPQVSLTTEDGDDFAVWFGRRGSIFIEEKGGGGGVTPATTRHAASVTRNEHGQVSLAVPKSSN